MEDKNITERPWGEFWDIYGTDDWHLKIIEVKPKSRLSLQSHNKRREIWIVVEGDIKSQVGEDISQNKIGDMIRIDVAAKHRLSSENGGKIVEVSFGKFEEDDIIRYEDDYGRVKNS